MGFLWIAIVKEFIYCNTISFQNGAGQQNSGPCKKTSTHAQPKQL